MLSRVAENLYWIARYVERAENVARLLDDAFRLELEAGTAGNGSARPLEGVVTILGCQGAFPPGGPPSREAILNHLTFDPDDAHAIRAMVARARENARGTQETLSVEAWSRLNQLYLYLTGPRARRSFQSSPSRFYERIKRECVLFAGLIDGTLPRTEVYHFLQVGRYLERVDMLARLLNVRFHTLPPDAPTGEGAAPRLVQWASLLHSCSAYECYLRQYQDQIEPVNVVGYLVLEESFPRAMRFAVARCLESLEAISGGSGTPAGRQLGRLDSELRYMDLAEIYPKGISRFLAGVQDTCNRVGREISQAYFLT
jgi:uncharacterized alpha-E superfamily protein